jgi:protein associated with RNAse G/E
VQALRADGRCYRSWSATVERVHEDSIVLFAPAGNEVEDVHGHWLQQHNMRSFYWFERPYNLLEVYGTDGALEEIYVNIASPARLDGPTLTYTDYELDVSMLPGELPCIVDEDEFAGAAVTYGYSSELQHACQVAAQEALQVAASWDKDEVWTTHRS